MRTEDIKPLWYTQDNFFTEEECDIVRDTILELEPSVLEIPNTVITPYPGLTAKFGSYNWLPILIGNGIDIQSKWYSVPEMQQHDALHIDCWANVFRQGEGIQMHCHAGGYEGNWDETDNEFYNSHVFISGRVETGTYYKHLNTTLESVKGQLHLFDCQKQHKVVLNQYQEPRITLAMDVHWGEKTKVRADGVSYTNPNRYTILRP